MEPTPTTEKKGMYETILGDKPAPVRYFVNTTCIIALLYLFLLGLDLMGNAFKGLSGKGVGGLLSGVENPMAGLAVGVLATVLLQSSSTTTSIVVTMVAADIISVNNAIPMIMGANIGTSVTNTIVAHGHVSDTKEFESALAGATVHDSFNLLTVLIFLPLEVLTQAISGSNGLLGAISESIADGMVGTQASTFTSPVKIIVGPVKDLFIGINKDLIKIIAKGCQPCDSDVFADMPHPDYCVDHLEDENEEEYDVCIKNADWVQKYEVDGRVVKKGFAYDMGDGPGSTVVLLLSILFLCVALFGIVRLLHYLVLSSGRTSNAAGEETMFIKYTRKVLQFNSYLSILFGMLITILVQSSSITTSTLTPLVALGIISVEDMLPLTLGANIGTTCTAFLASVVAGKKAGIQIALCHLFFNIFGILIWFPVPMMRKVPLAMCRTLAHHSLLNKGFGVFYIMTVFIIMPALLFAFSFAIALGPGGIFLNIILDVLTVGSVFWIMKNFDKAYAKQRELRGLPALAMEEKKPESSDTIAMPI